MKVVYRLWGDAAKISDAALEKSVKKVAKEFGVKPSDVEAIRMVGEALASYVSTDKRLKRGGVDGG